MHSYGSSKMYASEGPSQQYAIQTNCASSVGCCTYILILYIKKNKPTWLFVLRFAAWITMQFSGCFTCILRYVADNYSCYCYALVYTQGISSFDVEP